MTLSEAVSRIEPLDGPSMEQARRRWDSVAKPLHSLGRLEDAVVQIAGIRRSSRLKLDRKGIVIMCADNGVVEEGISQSGQNVTKLVSENFLSGISCCAIMAKMAGAQIFPVDVGIASDTILENRKIAYGTRNMKKGPAMTRDQAVAAIEAGINKAEELAADGYDILGTGEMGIGNTTTSSAVSAVLTGLPVEMMTGRGAGLSTEGLNRKVEVIREAIRVNSPDPDDVIDVLAKVGGFDIAALCGVFLGGAACRIPVVTDGFISGTAAFAAVRLCPGVRNFILPSHVSKEPAGWLILDELSLNPFLTCEMSVGEGSGCAALFPLLDMAVKIYETMSSFDEINLEAYQPLI